MQPQASPLQGHASRRGPAAALPQHNPYQLPGNVRLQNPAPLHAERSGNEALKLLVRLSIPFLPPPSLFSPVSQAWVGYVQTHLPPSRAFAIDHTLHDNQQGLKLPTASNRHKTLCRAGFFSQALGVLAEYFTFITNPSPPPSEPKFILLSRLAVQSASYLGEACRVNANNGCSVTECTQTCQLGDCEDADSEGLC